MQRSVQGWVTAGQCGWVREQQLTSTTRESGMGLGRAAPHMGTFTGTDLARSLTESRFPGMCVPSPAVESGWNMTGESCCYDVHDGCAATAVCMMGEAFYSYYHNG